MAQQQQQQPPQQQQHRAIFADVPGGDATSAPLGFEPAVILMFHERDMPPNRPDVERRFPQPVSQHAERLINAVNRHHASDLYQQRGGARVAQERNLTADEAKAITAFTIEGPPLYLWLNAWMVAGEEARGEPSFLNFLGLFAVLFLRALQKLEVLRVPASRGLLVHDIPALVGTFENREQRLQPGSRLNFWNFASFTRGTEIAARFAGGPGERAIIYQCPGLACVSLRPFSAMRHDEEEVMPIAPLRLVVEAHTLRENDNSKLIIGVRQVEPELSASYYVEPRAVAGGGAGGGVGGGAVSAEQLQRALRELEERLRGEQQRAVQAAVAAEHAEQQQQQQRLKARIRELEAAAAGRGAGGGAAAQPDPAPPSARERAMEWCDRGRNLSGKATVRCGDRDYNWIDCFVESILADDSYLEPWYSLGYRLFQTGGTVTINGRVYNSSQCDQRYSELEAAENAAGKK